MHVVAAILPRKSMLPQIRLTVDADQRPEKLAELTREVLSDLEGQSGLSARQGARDAAAGERAGEVPLLGQLILTFVTAGAATALINCLKSYIERDRRMKFRLRKNDGTELELDGARFDAQAIGETIRQVERFLRA